MLELKEAIRLLRELRDQSKEMMTETKHASLARYWQGCYLAYSVAIMYLTGEKMEK